MKIVKRTGAYAFLLMTILSVASLIYMFAIYQSAVHMSYLFTNILFIVGCIFLFYLLSKDIVPIPISKQFIWRFLFLLYIILLAYLLFFSKEFARDCISDVASQEYLAILKYEWNYGTNLVPFSSIHDMVITLTSPIYRLYSYVNIFGNLLAFMPFAFFITILYKKITKTKFFFLLSFLVICVEFTQFFTLSGTLDIDDYILNVFGGMLLYSVLKSSYIQTLLRIKQRS